jgi:hypothetical protein
MCLCGTGAVVELFGDPSRSGAKTRRRVACGPVSRKSVREATESRTIMVGMHQGLGRPEDQPAAVSACGHPLRRRGTHPDQVETRYTTFPDAAPSKTPPKPGTAPCPVRRRAGAAGRRGDPGMAALTAVPHMGLRYRTRRISKPPVSARSSACTVPRASGRHGPMPCTERSCRRSAPAGGGRPRPDATAGANGPGVSADGRAMAGAVPGGGRGAGFDGVPRAPVRLSGASWGPPRGGAGAHCAEGLRGPWRAGPHPRAGQRAGGMRRGRRRPGRRGGPAPRRAEAGRVPVGPWHSR